MKTKAELQNIPKQPVSTVNKNLHKQQDGKTSEKKPNVRTTDYKKMEEIFLTDPDSVTREEFLFFQSAVGYRRAMQLLNEGQRRKQLSKMDGTGKTVRNIQQNKEQDKLDINTNQKNVIQKQKLSQVSQLGGNETIQKKSVKNISSFTSLPSNLRAGLENLSGIDLSDVSVHKNSDKPQQVGAFAYTQGNNIHIAPGQEKHLPHEGWHAVQQKQGRVAPTMQMKSGTLMNDDSELEKEADVMGSKAVEAGKQTDTLQLKKTGSTLQDSRVIQRKTENQDKIQPAYYGEKNENVKKIQQVLIKMNYWVGSSDDKATGYFGDITKQSLINYQLGYMKLKKDELYDKKGNYVGCGPKTVNSLNNNYQLLYNPNVPQNVKDSIINTAKENNKSYTWNIKAGVYNGNVKEAQLMLMNLGHKLPKYGADGKWNSSGETFNAIKKFQNACKVIYDLVSKHGNKNSLKHVSHFKGIKPTGMLDEITFKALQEQNNRKAKGTRAVVAGINSNTNNNAVMTAGVNGASNLGDINKNYNVYEEYGAVHKEVQVKASAKYALTMEHKVKGGGLTPGKTDGWADLVDKKTHEVWEVKNDNPKWNETSGVGRRQLERYILASKKYGNFYLVRGNPRIKIEPFKTNVFGKPATVTVRSGLGAINDLENGMIYYKVKYDKEEKEPQKVPQEVPSAVQEREWWEIPVGVGLVIVCAVATVILIADDATGIGAADDPLLGGTLSGIAKGAQMIFAW